MSELAIEVQNQELEQEQVELMNKYGLQNFNELFEAME